LKRGNLSVKGNSQYFIRRVIPNVFSRDKIPA
jgi:magnesium-transporting ATPase (P-type)